MDLRHVKLPISDVRVNISKYLQQVVSAKIFIPIDLRLTPFEELKGRLPQ